MKSARKYKPKRPIHELDDAAAQHRRAQASRAQRAYRQRKEDTISTLTLRITNLEGVIDNLSACFLALSDKLLSGFSSGSQPALVETLRDSMTKFKSIIDSCDSSSEPATPTNHTSVNEVVPEFGTIESPRSSDSDQPSTALSLQHNDYTSSESSQIISPGPWPTYTDTTVEQLPDPLYQSLLWHDPYSLVGRNLRGFAQKLWSTSVQMAIRVLYGAQENDASFQRIFKRHLLEHPAEQVRARLGMLLQTALHHFPPNPHLNSPRNSTSLSVLEVALLCFRQGLYYDEETSLFFLQTESRFNQDHHQLLRQPVQSIYQFGADTQSLGSPSPGSFLMISASGLIQDLLSASRCEPNGPAFDKDAANRAVLKALAQPAHRLNISQC